jgi:hypothetical protein
MSEACNQGGPTAAKGIEDAVSRLTVVVKNILNDFRWEASTVGMKAMEWLQRELRHVGGLPVSSSCKGSDFKESILPRDFANKRS